MELNYYPYNEGLYNSDYEHDACGVGFVAQLKGKKSHTIVAKGLELLANLEHRGAVGSEKNSGDGAGILTQIPDAFLRRVTSEIKTISPLPPLGSYGVGVVFLPRDPEAYSETQSLVEQCIEELGQEILGWRILPTDNSTLGNSVKATEPIIKQIFIKKADNIDTEAFERKLFVIRKYTQSLVSQSKITGTEYFYIASMSSKTISYKGQLITEQLPLYFPDLNESDYESAIALVHSRFSTNTFPSWPLAQPFRYIAHNGEINTLKGNVNWMKARASLLESKLFSSDELDKIYPFLINEKRGSDSSILDNVIELLVLAGRSLPHVMAMLIPEAWGVDEISEERKAFYEYHATFMEPWDGPASVVFSDGKMVGAILDRNGLRPSRYSLTKDDMFVLASEQGALEFESKDIVLKGRLQPGGMIVADLEEGRLIYDNEIKEKISGVYPYKEWLDKQRVYLDDLPLNQAVFQPNTKTIEQRQKCYGYTKEDLKIILTPMVENAYEATGSMGNDASLAVLSRKSNNLYNYFHQLFAQVTNPPIDPIREESVMSLISYIGSQGNLFQEVNEERNFIRLDSPILDNIQMTKLKNVSAFHFKTKIISTLFNANQKGAMQEAIERIKTEAYNAVKDDEHQILILSTRGVNEDLAPIPTLLITSAVHQYLTQKGVRTKCGLVIESAEPREIHHFATLIGYGANAINPFLAFETIEDMRRDGKFRPNLAAKEAIDNYIKAINKGLMKIMS
ncbi:MAG: glutamate synthase subunit alpha, partial [Epsilonproteobacteria bacterium]